MAMIQRSILVVDADPSFLVTLAAVPQANFLVAKSAIEAQHVIANRQNRIAAICINPSVSEPDAVPLIRFCRAHRPATPITLLSDDPKYPPADLDLQALQVQKVLHKPITAEQLVQKLIPTTVFELDKAIELSRQDQTAAGGEVEQDDGDMHAIEADSFLCGSTSFFDVFVKLSGKKYVKILKAKDAFDTERVGSYLKKGVKHFYIKKQAQIFFLQYCDKLTEAILAKPKIAANVKQQQVQNLGRLTNDLLRNVGISETSVLAASKFVEYTHKLTKTLDLRSVPKIAAFLQQLKNSEHTTGTSMIVSLLLTALDFRDEDVISVIALGGFLHDIGLLMLPDKLGEKDYDELTPEQREVFETHPTLGADLVAKIPGVSPLVTQIVRQHHERRNRKGYPSKLGPGAIAPMAEIVGIADTFQELIAKAVKDPAVNPLELMEKVHFDDFSFQTVEGFRKAFLIVKK